MSLLLLKDDILLQLITYLSPLEALHLSLTTREIYPLAILQVPTVVQCFTTAKLAKVLSYMLADIPNRARRLRDFEITRGALQIELVPLVGDLFQQAVNLRRVSIDPLADFIEHDPRIGEAISALARLESLEVYEMHEDEAIAVVKQLCSSPRRLFLSDLERDDAFPLIFSIIPSFTRLQHLELSSFGIEGCTSGPLTSPIYMPSVRYLRIFSSVVPWSVIVDSFPNIQFLEYDSVSSSEESNTKGKCWRALRRLNLDQYDDAVAWCPVHWFGLIRPITDLEDDMENALEGIRTVSPVVLSLNISLKVGQRFWGNIPQVGPKVRFVELFLQDIYLDQVRKRWLAEVSPTLHSIPLVCMRIITPPISSKYTRGKGMSDDMRRQKLPRLFVELFPSLRYIAYACEMWDASNERLDGDDAGKRFTWWRITGSGPERKLTEISWWQGECVRWFLLNSDFESIENMDWDDGEIPDRA